MVVTETGCEVLTARKPTSPPLEFMVKPVTTSTEEVKTA
jgi:hypothetical protein